MVTTTLILIYFIAHASGVLTGLPFKGCYSTSFVQRFSFYYKINRTLSIQQGVAACNNRLTKYLGLQVDENDPASYHVYCGNDLTEVSYSLTSSRCEPCTEYSQLSCGGQGSMSVYLMREETPFAVLLAKDDGIEIQVDNIRWSLVNITNFNTISLDYLYTADTILSVTLGNELMRSQYNTSTMRYSDASIVEAFPVWTDMNGLAVDFTENVVYWGNSLSRTNLNKTKTEEISADLAGLTSVSVDPYNRSVMFMSQNQMSVIYVYLWDTNTTLEYDMRQFQVESISALTYNIQEQLIYAILTTPGNQYPYLASIDYNLTPKEMFFSGSFLENSHTLEVYNEVVIWAQRTDFGSIMYKCNLTSECRSRDFETFNINGDVHDFTIYHPEKQAPGEKRLCADLTCTHGCKAFSPFLARCSCPPGLKMDLDNVSCYEETSTSIPRPTLESTTFHKGSFSTYLEVLLEEVANYYNETSTDTEYTVNSSFAIYKDIDYVMNSDYESTTDYENTTNYGYETFSEFGYITDSEYNNSTDYEEIMNLDNETFPEFDHFSNPDDERAIDYHNTISSDYETSTDIEDITNYDYNIATGLKNTTSSKYEISTDIEDITNTGYGVTTKITNFDNNISTAFEDIRNSDSGTSQEYKDITNSEYIISTDNEESMNLTYETSPEYEDITDRMDGKYSDNDHTVRSDNGFSPDIEDINNAVNNKFKEYKEITNSDRIYSTHAVEITDSDLGIPSEYEHITNVDSVISKVTEHTTIYAYEASTEAEEAIHSDHVISTDNEYISNSSNNIGLSNGEDPNLSTPGVIMSEKIKEPYTEYMEVFYGICLIILAGTLTGIVIIIYKTYRKGYSAMYNQELKQLNNDSGEIFT